MPSKINASDGDVRPCGPAPGKNGRPVLPSASPFAGREED
jgi:hypothetical protein